MADSETKRTDPLPAHLLNEADAAPSRLLDLVRGRMPRANYALRTERA